MYRYTLPTDCPVRWTATQERSLSNEFPAPSTSSSSSSKTAYNQFLWLPESIMPLTHLIPAIRRAGGASEGGEFAGLLLTARQCSQKYHTAIPQILANPEAEVEDEGMALMWFAFRNEKPLYEDEEDMEERWRKAWLERMERREVQIQILLHFYALQHPLPPPVPTPPRKKQKKKDKDPVIPIEDRLETLMDKLAMWQLLGTISPDQMHASYKGKERADDRDWMQKFCEDIVQPAFGKELSEMYDLLHSKLFRHSLFSSSSGDEGAEDIPPRKAKPKGDTRIKQSNTDASSRSRSRSLSISLEAERRASNNGVGKKRMLSREVSMSKVFRKTKTQPVSSASTLFGATKKQETAEMEIVSGTSSKESGKILVESTPIKDRSRQLQRFGSHHAVASFNIVDNAAEVVKMEVDDDEDANMFALDLRGRSLTSYSIPEDGGEEDGEDEWLVGSPSLRAHTVSSSDPEDLGSPDALLLGS